MERKARNKRVANRASKNKTLGTLRMGLETIWNLKIMAEKEVEKCLLKRLQQVTRK